ncbi:MAG: tetratricopeptide repeat protein [Terriglobia bacterium]
MLSSSSLREVSSDDRLSSWKEIATYLKCGIRTVQRWESVEGLPVHRHVHLKNSTVYAFKAELDAWRNERRSNLPELSPPVQPEAQPHAKVKAREADAEEPPTEIEEPQPVEDTMPAAATRTDPADEAYEGSPWRVNRYGLALAAVLVLAAYSVRQLLRPQVKPQAGRTMLAVLPFANLSGDPTQDYFSDGLTEEMITELGGLNPRRLGVIARTSVMKYKHSEEGVAAIGRQLGVSYILEGSVRRAQDRVRISAQLIRVSDRTHLWARSYDGQLRDVLKFESQAARAIAGEVAVKLAPHAEARLARPQPVDPEAYELYLKGRYFWNQRTPEGLHKAVDYFTHSSERDPSYAPAYAGLAEAWALIALDTPQPLDPLAKAKAAAVKAIQLDDGLPEAHTSLAGVKILCDWDWAGAEQEFKRALAIDPQYGPAHHWYATLYLGPQGRTGEAIAEMRRALEIDPLSLIYNTDLGWTLFIARRYDAAIQQYRQTLEMDPHFEPAHYRLQQAYAEKGMYVEAVAEEEKELGLIGAAPQALTLQRIYAKAGYQGVLTYQLDLVRDAPKKQAPSGCDLAERYLALGDKPHALEALRAGLKQHDPALIFLKVDPAFDGLRSSPEFQDLERRIGLTH